MQITLCESFPALSPFDIREKRACEVFLLIKRLNEYNLNRSKAEAEKIRRKAGDDWF